MSLDERQQEIRKVIKEYPLTYPIMLALALLVIGIWIGANVFGKNGLLGETDNGYTVNLYTEILSVIGTVGIIEVLNRHREEKRRERDLREQLILNAGSMSNEIAKDAIHQLGKRGWLVIGQKGVLKGQNLQSANLQSARLTSADLQSARLVMANLSDAYLLGADLSCANLVSANLFRAYLHAAKLTDANLSVANLVSANLQSANLAGANMQSANLQTADLYGANLQEAVLIDANLQGTVLSYTKLQKTNLSEANLQGTLLEGAEFSEDTVLPDGSKWTPDTDMRHFTDSDHLNFWRKPFRH